MSNNILSAFNDHFMEFLNDVHMLFPADVDVLTAKNALLQVRKANPKMIVKIWQTFIVDKYRTEIESGTIDFFINKDYSDDLMNNENSSKILSSINRLRDPIRQMDDENQKKTMKYIQNLTKLSDLCR